MRDPRHLAPGIRQCPVLRHKTQAGISLSLSLSLSAQVVGTKERSGSLGSGAAPSLLQALPRERCHRSASQELRPPRRECCTEKLREFLLEAGQMELWLLPGANAVTLSQGMLSV